MNEKFLRWAIVTALKLLYIIASGSRTEYFSIHKIRQEIEAEESE